MDEQNLALARRNKERAMELGAAYFHEFYNPCLLYTSRLNGEIMTK